METIIKSYYFDTRNPDEANRYKTLCRDLAATNGKCFESWGAGSHYNAAWLDGEKITLATKNLFANQWNSDLGRVFNWAQDYPAGKNGTNTKIKRGHYLLITEEMRAILSSTVKCRYCGHEEPVSAGHCFCPKCIGSEYLTEKDLKLTRMMRVNDESAAPELTEAEAAELLPKWRIAQGMGKEKREEINKARKRQKIANLVKEAEEKGAALVQEAKAKAKAEAFTWLMDAGYRDIDNVIYYRNPGQFCFGWMKPLNDDEFSSLVSILGTEFPFAYDIKRA